MVEEVDEQTFDVGAILILVKESKFELFLDHGSSSDAVSKAGHLIGHDHDPAVTKAPQRLRVIVALLVLQADNFNDVVYLCVLHDLGQKDL